MTDHADTIRRDAEDRLREWLTTDDPAPSYAWTDPDVLIPDLAALLAEVDSLRAERQQAIDERDAQAKAWRAEVYRLTQSWDKISAERKQAIDERDAALQEGKEFHAQSESMFAQLEAVEARCEQAIDALREIAKPQHTWSELDFEEAQEIARAALLNLGEQPLSGMADGNSRDAQIAAIKHAFDCPCQDLNAAAEKVVDRER